MVLLGLGAGAAAPLAAQRPAPMETGILRVCADPDNLPESNSAGEGYENKLAELLAATWNAKLEYTWWAAPRGQMRMLNGMYCDLFLQAPTGFDMAGVTRPYYRTSYVIVQRKNAAHRVTGLGDPALKTMKIGVHLFAADGENTPPAMALSAHGVVGNLVGFSTTYMGGQNAPGDIIKAVASDSVDLAIVWGPIAGYWTKQLGADLILTPVLDDSVSGIPFFRDSLQKFLDAKAPEIRNLLEQYGIPLLPLAADTSVARSTPPAR
jgi:quinoprotein dehydrogenase-associated probable ABC transporter substrate-binding protein